MPSFRSKSLVRSALAGAIALLALAPVVASGSQRPAPGHLPARKPPDPIVSTSRPDAVTGSGARIAGKVDPDGRPTMYWFEYGTSTRYGSRTAARPAGSGRRRRRISATLSGLTPFTTYHYRVVAASCMRCRNRANGVDVTFTTSGYSNAVYTGAAVADPFVLDNGGTHNDYWVFSTGELFPMLHSTDLVHWTSAGNAMTKRPAWVVPSGDWHPWAPSVVTVQHSCPGTASPSCYVMYYVGVSAQFSVNCVAIATATRPGGPYIDRGPLSNGQPDAIGRPIGCGDTQGYGNIDPSVFVDPTDGLRYVYVSTDFACAQPSGSCTTANGKLDPTISVIPLSDDFLSAAGNRTPLLTGDAGTWESTGSGVPTVEEPAMMLHDGTYYLLYSGGDYHAAYGMGYATAPSPTGPFVKWPRNPILAQNQAVFGPGGGDAPIAGPHGHWWLVYHGRDHSDSSLRTLRIDPFSWHPDPVGPDVPVIAGPTSGPQAFQP